MERIMIMGCAGAGKSTLTQNLSQVLNLPTLHIDTIFWSPGWKQRPKEEFEKAHEDFLENEKWVIDGNYLKIMDKRVEKADTIVHLDFSTLNCLYGVVKRRIQFHGKTRPDLGEGCPEKIDWEFFKWVWNFNGNQNVRIKEMLAEQKDKKIIVLKNRGEIDKFVEEVKNSVKEKRPLKWD